MNEYDKIKLGRNYLDVLKTYGLSEFTLEKLNDGLPYSFDIIVDTLEFKFIDFGNFDFGVIRAYKLLDEGVSIDERDIGSSTVACAMLSALKGRGVPNDTLDILFKHLPHSFNEISKVCKLTDEETIAYNNARRKNACVNNANDTRYNNPKGAHGFPKADIDEAIFANDIYSELRERLLNAQRSQVGYGLAKYPETLNKDSWSTIETLDHIIEESVDRLHYMIMLKQKLQSDICEDPKALKIDENWASSGLVDGIRNPSMKAGKLITGTVPPNWQDNHRDID